MKNAKISRRSFLLGLAACSAAGILTACKGDDTPASSASTSPEAPASSVSELEPIGLFTVEDFPKLDGSTACIPLMAQMMADTTGIDLEVAQSGISVSTTAYAWENFGLYPDEIGRPWQSRIVREIERCEQTAALVGHFAQELAIAAGDRNENAGGAVCAQFYFAVDQPFRQWLQAIDPEQDDPDEAALRWQAQVRNIAEKLGKQMVMEAGNAALKGHRIVVDKDKKTERTILYTSPKAYNRFRTRLWEIYPKTEP